MLSTEFKIVANMALIDLPSATMDGYTTAGGVFVAPKPNERLEDAAAVIGTVAAVSERFHYNRFVGEDSRHQGIYEKIPIQIQEGDRVAVDYRVVSAGEWKGDVFEHSGAWILGDKLVWKAEAYSMIAKWVEDHWQALGDYVLMKPYVREKYTSSILYIPETVATEAPRNIGLHVSGLEVGQGTKLIFDPEHATPYRFDNGEEMLVINKGRVFGTIED